MSLKGLTKPGHIIKGRVSAVDYILMTAYGIALKHGFEGTEEEWLESLDGTRVPESTLAELVNDYLTEHPVESGTTFYPSVDSEGNLSWTNDGDEENPETVNIKGADGAVGADGYTPVKGTDYYTEEEKAAFVEEVLDSLNLVSAIDFTNWDNGSFTEVVDGETITHTVVTGENTITIDGVVITFPEDA